MTADATASSASAEILGGVMQGDSPIARVTLAPSAGTSFTCEGTAEARCCVDGVPRGVTAAEVLVPTPRETARGR